VIHSLGYHDWKMLQDSITIVFLDFPIYLQYVEITFNKWRVGRRGRIEECSVAPFCNKRIKTLCSCNSDSSSDVSSVGGGANGKGSNNIAGSSQL
jgi:hypothetical protein